MAFLRCCAITKSQVNVTWCVNNKHRKLQAQKPAACVRLVCPLVRSFVRSVSVCANFVCSVQCAVCLRGGHTQLQQKKFGNKERQRTKRNCCTGFCLSFFFLVVFSSSFPHVLILPPCSAVVSGFSLVGKKRKKLRRWEAAKSEKMVYCDSQKKSQNSEKSASCLLSPSFPSACGCSCCCCFLPLFSFFRLFVCCFFFVVSCCERRWVR